MTMNLNKQIFAMRVKQAREETGMTQEELGEAVGRTFSTVSRWETASDPNLPSLRIIHKLSQVLGKPVLYFTQDAVSEEVSSTTPTLRTLQPDEEILLMSYRKLSLDKRCALLQRVLKTA